MPCPFLNRLPSNYLKNYGNHLVKIYGDHCPVVTRAAASFQQVADGQHVEDEVVNVVKEVKKCPFIHKSGSVVKKVNQSPDYIDIPQKGAS
jgi:hypothetical protein